MKQGGTKITHRGEESEKNHAGSGENAAEVVTKARSGGAQEHWEKWRKAHGEKAEHALA